MSQLEEFCFKSIRTEKLKDLKLRNYFITFLISLSNVAINIFLQRNLMKIVILEAKLLFCPFKGTNFLVNFLYFSK
jgi:hypothetical protein